MGFHFAGFALTPSAYPANWDWYHNTFLGSGSYVSITWRPTAAVLRVEDPNHPATARLPRTFASAPNEWYRWEKELRENRDIDILVAIDPTSFPLGTGPKLTEIWRSGYYPVVWTNPTGWCTSTWATATSITNTNTTRPSTRWSGWVGGSPHPTQTRFVNVMCVTAAEGTCSVHA